jgi:hypothetical protein
MLHSRLYAKTRTSLGRYFLEVLSNMVNGALTGHAGRGTRGTTFGKIAALPAT